MESKLEKIETRGRKPGKKDILEMMFYGFGLYTNWAK